VQRALLPTIPSGWLDQLVTGPMTAAAVEDTFQAFKKALIERALAADLTHHPGYEAGPDKPEGAENQRNGTSGKTVLTETGALRIEVPRDRLGGFDPLLIPKHHKPTDANRTFSVMRKMFNLAEVWGYRPDGTNPCRHVPMYPNGKATHLISDEEMGKLFRYFEFLETYGLGLDHAILSLAIRLQFEFAGRRSEIHPPIGVGGSGKPACSLARQQDRRHVQAPERGSLLAAVHRAPPGQLPARASVPEPSGATHNHWRVLRWLDAHPQAGRCETRVHPRHPVPIGHHIANSGIPVKVGMALTAHKTVAMFMRYVHTEDKPVREAAELVANRRKTIVAGQRTAVVEQAPAA